MKHVVGVVGVLLAIWRIGSVYNAVVDIEWLQGVRLVLSAWVAQ
jgi:hypothetical protein